MTQDTPKHILVIDDDIDYRKLLVHLLGKALPNVKVSSLDPLKSGLPGASFDWGQFDVVLIDYNLGKAGSGLECVNRIRKTPKNPPATIVLTAEGNEVVAAKAFRQGVHDYLRKQGLTGKVLTNSIRSAFEVRASQTNKSREISLNATQFSRTFFYEQVNLAREEAGQGKSRALLLVRPNRPDSPGKPVGLQAMDEITRYLAKLTVKVLRVSKYPVRSTRFGESTIAVIAGDFGDLGALEVLVQKFLDAIEQEPPEFDGTRLPTVVRLGVVRILSGKLETRELLALAEHACEAADAATKSTFAIVDGAPSEQATEKKQPGAVLSDLRLAIRESRIQPMFRPLMPVSEASSKFQNIDIFQINPHVVGHDGQSQPASDIFKDVSDDDAMKMIDRWTLREVQKRLSGPVSGNMPGFLVSLSGPSSVDNELPNWIEKLLQHFGAKKRPAFFGLKVDPDILVQQTKAVVGICVKLRQRFGLRIVVGEVSSVALAKTCFAQMPVDLVQVSAGLIHPEKPAKGTEEERAGLMELINGKNALSIVAGIGDISTLHAAISAGVDFVQGDFVAPEQVEVDASAGVESVSL